MPATSREMRTLPSRMMKSLSPGSPYWKIFVPVAWDSSAVDLGDEESASRVRPSKNGTRASCSSRSVIGAAAGQLRAYIVGRATGAATLSSGGAYDGMPVKWALHAGDRRALPSGDS